MYLYDSKKKLVGKKDSNEVEVLDVEAHNTLEEAKPVNADDAEADDEEGDNGDEDDIDSGDDFRVEVNPSLGKEEEEDNDCEVDNSNEKNILNSMMKRQLVYMYGVVLSVILKMTDFRL